MIHKYYHRYRNSDGSCQNTAYKNIKCFRPSFHILKDLAFLILTAKTCFTHDHCISVKNTFEVKCSAIFKLQHSRVDRQRDQCSDAVFSVITSSLYIVCCPFRLFPTHLHSALQIQHFAPHLSLSTDADFILLPQSYWINIRVFM